MNDSVTRLLTEKSFMTAAGTETYLLFQQGFGLREFCAFEVFEDTEQLAKLEADYLRPLLSAVAANGHGLLLDTLVWRAHPDFVAALGYAPSDIKRLNELAVSRTKTAVSEWRDANACSPADFPVLIAGDIGPRGDGYKVGDAAPGIDSAHRYHQTQIDALAEAGIDLLCALTMTTANEAIGVARAAARVDLPIIVSPTVETDGSLPDGSSLRDFIQRVDDESGTAPLYYMVNCAHPTHLNPTLEKAAVAGEQWLDRFRGFRANASKKSHEELDNSTELDRGDPQDLAREVAAMKSAYGLRVVGGCCGTDVEHIAEIAKAV